MVTLFSESDVGSLHIAAVGTTSDSGMQKNQISMPVPVELLEAILTMTSPSDLARWLRSSSVLHSIGQPILYRHISNTKFDLRRSRSLLRTLSSNPRLASLVKTLTFRLPPSFGKTKDWELLGSTLRKTINIEELDLPLPSYGPGLLVGVVYPQLTSLKFMAFQETNNIPFDRQFLAQHPGIRALHLTGNNFSLFEQLPDYILPLLTILSVTHPRHVTNLAPNRPLNDVTVILPHHDLAPALAASLSCLNSASGSGVQVLRLNFRSYPGVSWDTVLDRLPGLPISTLTLEFARNGTHTLDQLSDLVTTLLHLRIFSVTFLPNSHLRRPVDRDILDWFILRPTLEVVSLDEGEIVHRRFTRRTELSVGVPGGDIGGDGLNHVCIMRKEFDELGRLSDEPENFSEWLLVGYIWEHVGGGGQSDKSLPPQKLYPGVQVHATATAPRSSDSGSYKPQPPA